MCTLNCVPRMLKAGIVDSNVDGPSSCPESVLTGHALFSLEPEVAFIPRNGLLFSFPTI